MQINQPLSMPPYSTNSNSSSSTNDSLIDSPSVISSVSSSTLSSSSSDSSSSSPKRSRVITTDVSLQDSLSSSSSSSSSSTNSKREETPFRLVGLATTIVSKILSNLSFTEYRNLHTTSTAVFEKIVLPPPQTTNLFKGVCTPKSYAEVITNSLENISTFVNKVIFDAPDKTWVRTVLEQVFSILATECVGKNEKSIEKILWFFKETVNAKASSDTLDMYLEYFLYKISSSNQEDPIIQCLIQDIKFLIQKEPISIKKFYDYTYKDPEKPHKFPLVIWAAILRDAVGPGLNTPTAELNKLTNLYIDEIFLDPTSPGTKKAVSIFFNKCIYLNLFVFLNDANNTSLGNESARRLEHCLQIYEDSNNKIPLNIWAGILTRAIGDNDDVINMLMNFFMDKVFLNPTSPSTKEAIKCFFKKRNDRMYYAFFKNILKSGDTSKIEYCLKIVSEEGSIFEKDYVDLSDLTLVQWAVNLRNNWDNINPEVRNTLIKFFINKILSDLKSSRTKEPQFYRLAEPKVYRAKEAIPVFFTENTPMSFTFREILQEEFPTKFSEFNKLYPEYEE